MPSKFHSMDDVSATLDIQREKGSPNCKRNLPLALASNPWTEKALRFFWPILSPPPSPLPLHYLPMYILG